MAWRLGKASRYLAGGALALLLPVTWLMPGTAGAAPSAVFISEVAPWGSGNTPYAFDWFELTNNTGSAVNITGWKMDDNSNSFGLAVPLSGVTSIAAGQSVIFAEGGTESAFVNSWFNGVAPAGFTFGTYAGAGVGLSTGGDAVNIYDASGTLVANVSFGASPAGPSFGSFDNTAGLNNTTISTLSVVGTNGAFAAANSLAGTTQIGSPGTAIEGGGGPTSTTTTTTTTTLPGPAYLPWPGSPNVQTVDLASTFSSNLSGLDYAGTGSATPGVIWGAVNGPGSLYRLVFNGTNWVPDTANSWGAGKGLLYPDGTGEPDSEGVTFVGDSASVDGIYIAAERNNLASATSRNSILRYDPTGTGTTLTATNEWNLTGDFPANGANLGFEAITWIQDSFLTGNGFFDDTKGHLYNPADYPNHGSGLFFVGVEATGIVYVYALDPTVNTFSRITSFSAGFTPATVMDLQFDRDLHDLWAVCDNGCNGRMHVLRINASGHFEVALRFERPATMPNTNNEGFAIAPATYCNSGFKPVFWADDNDIDGFSLRTGTMPCDALGGSPGTTVPEFPIAALPAFMVVAAFGGWIILQRRHRRDRPVVRIG